ncbi:hypothetical protein [Tianweitania sediminis]|nr:hypothetical protein [Tianweitania sediminis]
MLSCASDAIVLISRATDVDADDHPIQVIRTKVLADRIELVFSRS